MICDHHGYTRCDRLSAPPWLLSDGGIVPRVHGLERFSNEGGEGGGTLSSLECQWEVGFSNYSNNFGNTVSKARNILYTQQACYFAAIVRKLVCLFFLDTTCQSVWVRIWTTASRLFCRVKTNEVKQRKLNFGSRRRQYTRF